MLGIATAITFMLLLYNLYWVPTMWHYRFISEILGDRKCSNSTYTEHNLYECTYIGIWLLDSKHHFVHTVYFVYIHLFILHTYMLLVWLNSCRSFLFSPFSLWMDFATHDLIAMLRRMMQLSRAQHYLLKTPKQTDLWKKKLYTKNTR